MKLPVITTDALMEVLKQQFIQHPPPWKVDADWTQEVIASDGYCIAKCSNHKVAKILVEWADQHKKVLDIFEERFEQADV